MRLKYPLITILVGAPLGLLAGSVVAAEDGLAAGALTGVGTGALTGGITAVYVAWRDRSWAKWARSIRSPYDAEGIVHDGQARIGRSVIVELGFTMLRAYHLQQGALDGWLVLTNERLVFQPRRRRAEPIEVKLVDVAGVRCGAGLIPNTIEVRLHDKRSIEIRVAQRDTWLDKLALHDIKVMR